ncbi:TIGR03943 family putative permease subunit [Falsibacillus albus]|uniref:TIGR03943 family protein n=1 Tax=Falsibacillus albus TaxID=2478915 RepID=A0A3L7JS99_9BACI|nr:TIGR03943 family protein [Falsibacillus albus]RLQ93360.1 TIGR03943 family protein [Falsibacillus albus]
MLRFIVLLGFSFVFMQLHATGDISKYINMKYSYISFCTIFLLFFLTIMQLYFYAKEGKEKDEEGSCSHDAGCGCGHDHSHDRKGWKSWIAYPILIFPVITSLFLPVATLDSNIVKAKGYHFDVYNDGDPYAQHQFLEPDTSAYYGSDGYYARMDKALKKYIKQDPVVLTDANYLEAMEIIYKHPGDFMGKTLQFKGFAFNDKGLQNDQLFLFRFGIIHCVADSGVFGMLVQFPDAMTVRNDEWMEVEGKMTSEFYQPYKKTIPMIKVDKWKIVPKPKDPYVYNNYK